MKIAVIILIVATTFFIIRSIYKNNLAEKDVLQKMVDQFGELFPNGLQYKAPDGTAMDIYTLPWLNLCFLCMYMRLRKGDPTQVTNWLDQYNVDYKKLINNNRPPSLPLKDEEGVRTTIEEVRTKLKEVIKTASDVKGTKPVLVGRLEDAVKELKELEESLSGFFKEEGE